MIKLLVENYQELTVVGVFALLFVWYLMYQTKRQAKREDTQDKEKFARQEKRDKEQKEERDYYRGIITTELQNNEKLNSQGIILQREMMEDFKKHNGHAEKFSIKVVESLGLICDKMNGGSTTMRIAKEKLKERKD